MAVKRGLDLGGSEVRIGISKDEIFQWPAKCLEIQADAPVKTYLGEDAFYDDFIIVNHPMKELCGRRFVRNDVIDHYNGRTIVCDNQRAKTLQEATYINSAHAIAKIGAMHGDDDFSVTAGVCIPTSEFYADQDYVGHVKANMTGNYTVTFPLCEKTVNFSIQDGRVIVTPEGVVAVFSYSRVTSFREGTTLIVDVGERSTDITILKNFKPIGQSAASRPIGGINIEAYVRSELEKDEIYLNNEQVEKLLSRRYIISGSDLIDMTDAVISAGNNKEAVKQAIFSKRSSITDEDIDNAMNKYFIKQGDTIKDVTEYVTEAKTVFASKVHEAINEVLAKSMYSLSTVNNIVPIGRAFGGDVESSTSLVHILMNELNCSATVYQPDNLATANVSSIMAALGD